MVLPPMNVALHICRTMTFSFIEVAFGANAVQSSSPRRPADGLWQGDLVVVPRVRWPSLVLCVEYSWDLYFPL